MKRLGLLGIILLITVFVIIVMQVVKKTPHRSVRSHEVSSLANVSATPDSITQSPSPISYHAISLTRASLDHNRLFVLIWTAPENFVRDRMLVLANKLNQDYASESLVYAVLFDSEESVRNYNPAGGSYYVSKKLERGEYTLDRIKGKEQITFSSERGKPANEIKITLDSRPPGPKKRG
jgi:hypothetical protein